MPTVSQKWDIKSLIEHYAGIQVVGSANVHGIIEYSSNCPWCPGSTDSFKTRPETGQFTHAVRSSGCGRSGDAIDFLMDYVNMSRQEAVEELDLQGTQFSEQAPATRHVNSSDVAPPKKWQESAMVILHRAERYLWHPNSVKGREALDYLHGRGLKDETIKRARLGYVPLRSDGSWYRDTFEGWGLDPEQLTEKQKAKGGVGIANGILIPYFVGGVIWKLEVLRPGEAIMPRGQVLGSVDCLYGVDNLQYGDIAMMLESALDKLSVEQEAGDLLTPIATGGTPKCKGSRWIAELTLASFVLQSFDEDKEDENGKKPGDEGAQFWLDTLPRIERWSPMLWKDPNDLLQMQLKNETNGFTVREWAQLGVDLARHNMDLEIQSTTPASLAGQFNTTEFNQTEHIWCASGHMPQRVQYVDGDRSGLLWTCPCVIDDSKEDHQKCGLSFSALPEEAQLSPEASQGACNFLATYEAFSSEANLEIFANTVSSVVDIFGGPDAVVIQKHDGSTLAQHVRSTATYTPVTLPALPRTRCAHQTLTMKRVSDEMSNGKMGPPCKEKPLTHGWCEYHSYSHELLCIGVRIGYPEVILGKSNTRIIGEGVACWEAYAEMASPAHLQDDITRLETRFGL